MRDQKVWNWQQNDWPDFRFDAARLTRMEADFLRASGLFSGSFLHVEKSGKDLLAVELISEEAMKTSEIEGEILNRDSVQASIRRQFGLDTDHRRIPPAEQGVSVLLVDLHHEFDALMNDDRLLHWHGLLMNGRRDLSSIGCYRTEGDPMQVVSGPLHNPKVHFEAPASCVLPDEMRRFFDWYARTAPQGESPMPILTRAGICHLYFVSLHPFDDGNGRLARALAEKSIAEGLGEPILFSLSTIIHRGRKTYYEMLERNNKHNEITGWLVYFAQTILQAQAESQSWVEFLIEKTKLFDRLRGQLNERQEKVLVRMTREGPLGFKGGLSAENYLRLTGTSRPTATRDLKDLVDKGALVRSGALKGTRYRLPFGEEAKVRGKMDPPTSTTEHGV